MQIKSIIHAIVLNPILTIGFFLFGTAPSGNAETFEQIQKFKLSSCRQKACYRLNISSAEKGALNTMFAFEGAQIEILKKGAPAPKVINAGEGYYDFSMDLIVLRQIKNQSFQEMVINLESEVTETY